MGEVKATRPGSATIVSPQPETKPSSSDSKEIKVANSSTPSAQETKSSQQLATAKREEFGLSTISKTLNNTLDSAKKVGETVFSKTQKTENTTESKVDTTEQSSRTSSFAGVGGVDTSNLIRMNLLNQSNAGGKETLQGMDENPLTNQSAEIILTRFPKRSSTAPTTPTFKASSSPEDLFSMCEKGHERPNTIINTPGDADKSAQKMYQGFINANPGNSLPSTISPDSDPTSSLNREAQEVSRLLNEDYLGTTIHQRFSKTPPFFTTVPGNYFEAEGVDANAEYVAGTNQVMLSSDMKPQTEADRKRLMVHEQLHYAANLGGGDPSNMRWRDENDNPILNGTKPSAKWLHEGIGELEAQQLTRDMGLRPTESSYPQEMRVAFLIQKVVGDETVVRDAFLTGNFTEVRKVVNDTLPSGSPEGSFDRIMGANTPNEALMMLTNSMDEAGIDHASLLQDPILDKARPKHRIIPSK